ERDTVAQVGGKRDGSQLVLAVEFRRNRLFLQRRDGRQRHHAAIGRLDEDVLHIRRIVDRTGRGGELDRNGLAIDEDVDDLAALEQRLQRGAEIADVYAEIGSPFAINGDGDLRLVRLVVEARRLEQATVAQCIDQLDRRLGEILVVAADHRHLQSVAGTADAQAVLLYGEGAKRGYGRRRAVDVPDDFGLCALALRPRSQRQDHEAAVRRATLPRYGKQVLDLAAIAQRLEPFLDLLQPVAGIVEADAFRRRGPHHHHRPVFLRRQLAGHRTEGDIAGAGKQQRDDDDGQRHVEACRKRPAVEIRKSRPEAAEHAMIFR